jgi:ATP-binding cassette, subfamily C, bacterial LapB
MGVICAIVLEFLFRLLRTRLATAVCLTADRALCDRVYQTLNTMKFSALNRIAQSKRQQVLNQLDVIRHSYGSGNITSALDAPFSVLFILLVTLLNTWLGLITIIAALLLWFIGWVNQSPMKKATHAANGYNQHRGVLINTSIQSADTLRSFNAWPIMQKLWNDVYQHTNRVHNWLDNRRGFLQSLTQNSTTLASVCIYAVGSIQVVNGHMDIGMLIGANILAARALMPISKLANISESLGKARNAETQLSEFLRLPEESSEGMTLNQCAGTLTLIDIGFAYPNSRVALYEHLNITLSPGQITCFTGDNGSGKSTTALLLTGLLEPSRGQITLDGTSTQQLKMAWLRKNICYLPQIMNFLPGTLMENITLSNPKISEADFNNILRACDLRNFINMLPDSINTQMSENTHLFAQGIRKRIALARAIVTGGQIVILDDPSEALDEKGRNALNHVILQLQKQKRTIIIMTNDKELLQHAQQVVNLNEKPTPSITTAR